MHAGTVSGMCAEQGDRAGLENNNEFDTLAGCFYRTRVWKSYPRDIIILEVHQ